MSSQLPCTCSKRKYVLCWYWSHKFQVQLADGAIFHQSSIHRFQDQLGSHRILFLFSMMLHGICEFQAVKAFAVLPELAHEPVGTDAGNLDASQRFMHNFRSRRVSLANSYPLFSRISFYKKYLLFALCCLQSSGPVVLWISRVSFLADHCDQNRCP